MPELIASEFTLQPPLLPADLQDALSLALSATSDEGDIAVMDIRYAPIEAQKVRLEQYLEVLRTWLQPASQADIAVEIAAIFMSMGTKAKNDSDHEALIRIYITDLTDLPMFALRRACKDFRKGRKGNGEYAPTQAKLRAVAEAHCAPFEKTRGEITRVLRAKASRSSPRRRAEILKIAADTVKELARAPDLHFRPAGRMSDGEIESARRRAAMIKPPQDNPAQEP